MAKGRSESFFTPPCRLAFAQGLFEARSQQGGKPKYGATLIFDKAVDRTKLDAAVKKAIVEEWGDKGLEMARNGIIRSPFLDGESKEARSSKTGEIHPGFGPGVFFIRTTANADRPPHVRANDPNMQATQQEVYSGCYGIGYVNAFAWSNDQGGKGVSFGIEFFRKMKDGEPLGGGGPVDAAKLYEQLGDTGPVPAETKTGDGAGGLFG